MPILSQWRDIARKKKLREKKTLQHYSQVSHRDGDENLVDAS